MLHTFFHSIYVSDIPVIFILMGGLLLSWSVIAAVFRKKMTWIAAVLAILSLAAIFYVTLFSRTSASLQLHLIPFSSFERARANREIYRSMLMNVFLFMPLGLSLPFILRGGVGKRILLTALIAFALSVGIEAIQFAFSLGMVEADDVLCNAVGATLGACAYPLSRLWRTLFHRNKVSS